MRALSRSTDRSDQLCVRMKCKACERGCGRTGHTRSTRGCVRFNRGAGAVHTAQPVQNHAHAHTR
jgi:hypothetical protein